MLYLQTNESPVPQYPIVNWIPTHPETDQERYPQGGRSQPAGHLMLTRSRAIRARSLCRSVKAIYIPRFGWARAGLAWAMVLNRAQNQQDLYFIDAHSGHSRRVLHETDPAYIELHDPMGRGEHQGVRFSIQRRVPLAELARWIHTSLSVQLPCPPRSPMPSLSASLKPAATRWATPARRRRGQGHRVLQANKGDDRQEQLFRVPLAGGKRCPSPVSPARTRSSMS